MIKSRCGIVCDTEKCKEAFGVDCPGCLHISKPIWGDSCPVKDCCEGKKLDHCGECDDFPCELLNSFAFGKEHGSGDGAMIEQCKEWARLYPRQ